MFARSAATTAAAKSLQPETKPPKAPVPDTIVIALDGMGGDRAPDVVLRGAALAGERYPEARFLIHGDPARMERGLAALKGLGDRVELHPAEKVIANDARPSSAVRGGAGSSMWDAVQKVRDGEAAGVVSAGNTGALMAVSKFLLRTTPGVGRPAICSILPTLRAEIAMLDLGANIECDGDNLFEFAVLGAAFASATLGRRPSVGLLNVGQEELKGGAALRHAAARLRAVADPPFDFHGFIEGDDITGGAVDVVVTDGFTGNVALKALEGSARLYGAALRRAVRSSMVGMAGFWLARRAFAKVRDRLDPRRYNGAVFVGLNGVVVKAHGSSDAFAFANAIGFAVDMARHGFLDDVRSAFERMAAPVAATAS